MSSGRRTTWQKSYGEDFWDALGKVKPKERGQARRMHIPPSSEQHWWMDTGQRTCALAQFPLSGLWA